MVTMDGNNRAVFVDTNILIYASLTQSPFHSNALRSLASSQDAGSELWVSRQILREYLATLTRLQNTAESISTTSVIGDVRRFEQEFMVAEDSATVTAQLLNLLDNYPIGGKQIHDANIVATMLTHGITHLLTHNTSDFS